jgi:hypothetical protein
MASTVGQKESKYSSNESLRNHPIDTILLKGSDPSSLNSSKKTDGVGRGIKLPLVGTDEFEIKPTNTVQSPPAPILDPDVSTKQSTSTAPIPQWLARETMAESTLDGGRKLPALPSLDQKIK